MVRFTASTQILLQPFPCPARAHNLHANRFLFALHDKSESNEENQHFLAVKTTSLELFHQIVFCLAGLVICMQLVISSITHNFKQKSLKVAYYCSTSIPRRKMGGRITK